MAPRHRTDGVLERRTHASRGHAPGADQNRSRSMDQLGSIHRRAPRPIEHHPDCPTSPNHEPTTSGPPSGTGAPTAPDTTPTCHPPRAPNVTTKKRMGKGSQQLGDRPRHDQVHDDALPQQAGRASSYQVPTQAPAGASQRGSSHITSDHKRVTNSTDALTSQGSDLDLHA